MLLVNISKRTQLIKGVNHVPYRPVRPKYTVLASNPIVPSSYWSISGNTDHYRKSFFIFYFLSFVIFEFLLRQNGNLFALTY